MTIAPRPARVLDEQVHALYQGLPPIIAVHLLVGGVMVATLWAVFPGPGLRFWSAGMLAMLLGRAALYWHYRQHAHDDIALRHSRYFVMGAALSGLLWGIAGVAFFAPTLEYRLFVLFILVGMGAGAVSSLTAYMPAFLAYFPISLLPIALRMLLTDEPVTIGLGLMALAYVVALTFFARSISRSLAETWRLRFENIDLVCELSAQKLEAEQANLAKSRFLAAASHDLRQPLHALNLYVSLLDDARDMPRVRELSARIGQSVGTLQNLFGALLDISKLEAGTLVPEQESFSLHAMLDRLTNDFAVEATHRRLQLDIVRCREVVRTDPALLEQILRNYLSNALRYTRQGQVNLNATRMDDQVRIEVSDTGIGIDQAQAGRIFEEFYQVKVPGRDSGEGLGLGLAIVARVARLLKLRIGVHSEPGKGSTFFVEVPAGDPDAVMPMHDAPQDIAPALDRPVRILLIDDDPGIRESTQATLQNWGHPVITAASLPDALNRLADGAPDGIIVDYRLGVGQTGIDALIELEKRFGPRPAVVITGDVAGAPMRELMASGRQWLHKPVAPAKLRAFVQSVRRAASTRRD
ncbi:MAG: ATP-binding protein [Thiobacillus sp.]